MPSKYVPPPLHPAHSHSLGKALTCISRSPSQNTVASAQVKDKASNARAEFQAQVETANLASAAEGLLALISELKTAVVVQDISESDREAKNTKKALDDDVKRAFSELKSFRDTIATTLSSLERHYYESVPHVRAHDASHHAPN